MTLDEHLAPDPTDPLRRPEDVAREVLGESGELHSHRSLLRFITAGTPVKGRVVKLRAIRVGRTFLTTRRAFLAYLADLNPDTTPAASASGRSPVKRRRSSERAAAKLKTMGCEMEELLPVATVARRVLGDKTPPPALLRRWIEKGRAGRTLLVVRRDGQPFTSERVFRRFMGQPTLTVVRKEGRS